MPKVNHDILRWARETAGLSLEEAVGKLNIHDSTSASAVDRLTALEVGDTAPTRPMLLKMAKQYHRPLLTFYMSAPPRQGSRGQDFRTLPPGHSRSEEALLDALIRNVQARQGLVKAILEDEEDIEPLPFINSMNMSDGVEMVLASLKDILQLELDEFRSQSSPSEAFSLLRDTVESTGVFVLLIGNLGSHHTAIDVETFRGFALADELAPFIIINDQDAHSAWSFTLLHEFVHLMLGQTGVSGARAEIAVEQFCNDVAGEFLLPRQEIQAIGVDEGTDIAQALEAISDFAQARNVSSSMVTYKLFRGNMISHNKWVDLSRQFRRLWIEGRMEKRRKSRDQQGGGPNYFVVRRHRVGNTLINFVDRMMASGAVTTTKAGQILGVKPSKVPTLIDTGKAI
ncbi:MAG: XRE family transcriptional regulator [Proteobacteria bacterium]|nr:XRE family transcriptional regulator [Pseudomonadota bacterium]MBU1640981.1 XRE family transcriptional regulator [Pseudomonadota bacterium]